MINEKELRIGNLVMFRKDKIVEVSNLGNSFETIETVNGLRYGSDDINEYNPIALTEEWLIKFGFFKNFWSGYLYSYKFNHVRLMARETDKHFYFRFDANGSSVINVRYVHQLQNLYFALTNEELNIKL